VNDELQAFEDKKREKAEAKAKVLTALGEAKAAELEGRKSDADAAWAIVAAQGISGGVEGQAAAAMQAMADAYVAAHPDEYAFFERFIRPDGTPDEQEKAQDALVGMVNAFRRAGDTESQVKAEMFELARFPRKNIGARSRIAYRGVPSTSRKAGQ
jgi:hypothetical protein